MSKYIDKEKLIAELRKLLIPTVHDRDYDEWEHGRDSGFIEAISIIESLQQEQPKVELEKVYDAYCKVCGHYHHTTPAYICRHACDYFKDFEALLNARKEE